MTQMNTSMEPNRPTDRENLVVSKVGEAGNSRCKLSYMGGINSVLPHSAIQGLYSESCDKL